MEKELDNPEYDVLITGASSGIGLEAVKAFLREGKKVAVVGGREESYKKVQKELEALAKEYGGGIKIVPGDLLDEESDARTEVMKLIPQTRLVIANAMKDPDGNKKDSKEEKERLKKGFIKLFRDMVEEVFKFSAENCDKEGIGKKMALFDINSGLIPIAQETKMGGKLFNRMRYVQVKQECQEIIKEMAGKYQGANVDVSMIYPGVTNTGIVDGGGSDKAQNLFDRANRAINHHKNKDEKHQWPIFEGIELKPQYRILEPFEVGGTIARLAFDRLKGKGKGKSEHSMVFNEDDILKPRLLNQAYNWLRTYLKRKEK